MHLLASGTGHRFLLTRHAGSVGGWGGFAIIILASAFFISSCMSSPATSQSASPSTAMPMATTSAQASSALESLKSKDFLIAVDSGSLPAVSFVKPLGPDNEHPGYTSEMRGQNHVADLVRRIQASPAWKDTVIIITYDEFGGRWDHVTPPAGDRWGPGTRVPAIVVSPFAKMGTVDHTQYDTTSILRLIEDRYSLAPLADRDAKANSLVSTLNF